MSLIKNIVSCNWIPQDDAGDNHYCQGGTPIMTIYDRTGFHSLILELNQTPPAALCSFRSLPEVINAIRSQGFSGGVYGIELYEIEKVIEPLTYKLIFFAAGLDMVCPTVKNPQKEIK